jgi:hypothetical protein
MSIVILMEEVPQELLHHLGVFSVGAQEVRVRMAERVPADVADAQLFCYSASIS